MFSFPLTNGTRAECAPSDLDAQARLCFKQCLRIHWKIMRKMFLNWASLFTKIIAVILKKTGAVWIRTRKIMWCYFVVFFFCFFWWGGKGDVCFAVALVNVLKLPRPALAIVGREVSLHTTRRPFVSCVPTFVLLPFLAFYQPTETIAWNLAGFIFVCLLTVSVILYSRRAVSFKSWMTAHFWATMKFSKDVASVCVNRNSLFSSTLIAERRHGLVFSCMANSRTCIVKIGMTFCIFSSPFFSLCCTWPSRINQINLM